jgi:hypothetical protein
MSAYRGVHVSTAPELPALPNEGRGYYGWTEAAMRAYGAACAAAEREACAKLADEHAGFGLTAAHVADRIRERGAA